MTPRQLLQRLDDAGVLVIWESEDPRGAATYLLRLGLARVMIRGTLWALYQITPAGRAALRWRAFPLDGVN